MRLLFTLFIVLFLVFIHVGNIHVLWTPSLPTLPQSPGFNYVLDTNDVSIAKRTAFLDMTVLYFLILILWLIFLQYQAWLHMCSNTYYVPFDTNLNLFKKKKNSLFPLYSCLWYSSVCFTVLVLLSDYETNFMHFFLAVMSPNSKFLPCFEFIFLLLSKFKKAISTTLFVTSVIFILTTSTTPNAQYICVCVLQIFCLSLVRKLPPWLSILLILISNDIEQNPGPGYQSNFFSFMNWNLNSLATSDFNRIQLIEAHNSLHNYDLISICETSLTDPMVPNVPELDGYTFEPANHPNNVTHGGVGLFYKNSLPIVIRQDLSFSESIVVELKFGRKKIFFTVLYRSPSFSHNSPEFQDFIDNFKNLHSKINAENPFAMFFTGDFNGHSQIWWPDGNTNPEGREFEDLFNSLNLSQVISEPTNFTPGCLPSCIDLIVTDQPNLILDSGTRASLDPKCHHQIIYCKVNFKIPPPPPSERKTWHYHRANSDLIQRSLKNFPWAQHFSLNHDVNWQVKSFTEIFLNIMSNFIPNEVKRLVHRDPPWIDKHLKTMLNRKNRLYKNYKKHGYKIEDKIRLDAFREECKEAVENKKVIYLTNLGNKLNDPSTSCKSYWKIINRVMNKCRAPRIPPILFNNLFVLDCKEKAKLFNDFFSKQCKLISNSSTLPSFYYHTNKRFNFIHIQNEEILSLIRNINPNKTSGSDGISGPMLQLCDDSIVLPLKIIFDNILKTSVYPDLWKLANVTPIYKKNDKQLIKNYRPISLLPICGKMFEKIIFNNLYNYFNANNLITKNQSGFRPGDSTTNQLLYLVNEIHEAFEDPTSLEVRAVFLDISKAFDKVWHDGLIFKLRQNGVNGRLLKLFESYLRNRQQRVVINGSYSEYVHIESGVPQGSVLGPLLFLIYINDLEKNIKSNIKFFADDTMLFSIVEDPAVSATELNHDLDIICQWAHQWKMEFNPDITKQATEIVFSCKRIKPNHPQLTFNGNAVVKVKDQKHLGLTLAPNLSFSKHIHEKLNKAKKIIGIIRHISKYLPLKTLDQMYKALVRSHLDYCDIIYHQPETVNRPPLGVTLTAPMEEIERIQYQAALAITGAWKGSSRVKLYDELGWESLSDRRRFRRTLQIHKIESNSTPTYLKEKLPPHRMTQEGIPQNSFYAFPCRTERFMMSFFPDATASWNTFIDHFTNIPSYSILKTHLLSFFRPPKRSIFNIHDPAGIRFLFQLRLGLSPLRSHKRRHGFVDTPSEVCLCNTDVEDTKHFLFKCPFHAMKRASLATEVVPILIKNNLNRMSEDEKLYLYGNDSMSDSDNKAILLATMKFIKETNRFVM